MNQPDPDSVVLPPLPEPLTYIAQFQGEWRELNPVSSSAERVYTASQMHAYLLADRERRPAVAQGADEMSLSERAPYHAAWSEGDSESFAKLDDAKAWCQSEIDRWVRRFAVVPAND